LQPSQSPGGAIEPNSDETRDVLIAGCGTGQHAIDAALLFPRARVLAVDLSLASLAYARRKTREQGVTNVEYAQADVLKMDALNRTFDRIEVGGVLHHLADPLAGWRVLLSLLRSGGVMEVGLYSEIARRAIVAGRALIAQRGYPSTVQGIRACRREIFRAPNGSLIKSLATLRDFYGTSGCRDLLFHVMEHRFTLPQIKALLADSGVSFLGFETHPEILAAFRRRYPDPAALPDLDLWHAFETDNPEAFIGMYRFVIRKNR
jgi:SAM-dependent methyltransferase